MCFDGSGGYAPPPLGSASQAQPKRPVPPYSVLIDRLGQRGIAPLGARPLDERGCEVQPGERHLLHAARVEDARGVLPEHRAEDRRRGREAEGSPVLRVHVRHREREVGGESDS